MADLYRVDSPIDREQRNNLNLTLEDILKRFNNLQRQINILAGDNDVDELINRIADALNNSESTLEDLQTALTSAQQEISAIITATTNAINATEAANQATTDATQLFNDMTALQTDLEVLQTSLNQIITDANQATAAANTATNNANQATQDAQQATTDADNAASRAIDAAASIEGWGQAVPYQSGITYDRNNVVTYEYSTYQSLIDDNTSLPTDNTKWIVLARKGLDGQGAVQTVNERLPDEQGNVELGISDIDGLEVSLNEKANDEDLIALEETVIQHLTQDMQIGFNDYMSVELLKDLKNPFKRTNIKLIGDSITAGVGGTGYSATGETIGQTGFKANIPTATCWANSLKRYIESKYRKTFIIPMNDKNLKYTVPNVWDFQVKAEAILGTQFMFLNSTTDKGLTFNFYGESFNLYHAQIAAGGILEVYDNGVNVGVINGYNETLVYNNEIAFFLSENGYHEIEIRETGDNKPVYVAAIKFDKQVRVKNWGISGAESKYLYNNLQHLIEADDDVVICESGTNDRSNTTNVGALKAFQQGIIDYCIQRNKDVVLMSAIPAIPENTNLPVQNYTMADVDSAIDVLAAQNSLKFVSNYRAFLRYLDRTGEELGSLLSDTLHPNDKGYEIMYRNIVREIGF